MPTAPGNHAVPGDACLPPHRAAPLALNGSLRAAMQEELDDLVMCSAMWPSESRKLGSAPLSRTLQIRPLTRLPGRRQGPQPHMLAERLPA